ncbi:MAG: type IV pilus twitching motility protein PilT [Deltaproteobacteria bacterium]|nr:type IV pilus twitching motility protein PilT [Deltaproteobacteria bacterium]
MISDIIKMIIDSGASDLHLIAGVPPQSRIDGKIVPLGLPPLTPEKARELCLELLSKEAVAAFERRREFDLAVELEGLGRFRVNLYMQKGSIAGAFRPIPAKIPTANSLGIPQVVQKLCDLPRGLVLVTGPTGSGKSTTLSSPIDKINTEKPLHIVTIEDPIEFVHGHKKSVISQREIGKDSANFQEALKYVLRQDPDVILIGEMRDIETIAAAITISETGQLVFATLHTNSTVQTINRIIDVFPPHQQTQIRTQLSFVLEGVICQRLIPKIGGGRALGLEIMIPNPAIRNLIRENKLHQIAAQMQIGQETTGMRSLNQTLARMVQNKTITPDEAAGHSSDIEDLNRLLKPSAPANKISSISR